MEHGITIKTEDEIFSIVEIKQEDIFDDSKIIQEVKE
jgi:hypothetical protein